MTQILETMELPFHVEHVNIDQNRNACVEYGIRGIPHMILMDENNNIIKRISGVLTKDQLTESFLTYDDI